MEIVSQYLGSNSGNRMFLSLFSPHPTSSSESFDITSCWLANLILLFMTRWTVIGRIERTSRRPSRIPIIGIILNQNLDISICNTYMDNLISFRVIYVNESTWKSSYNFLLIFLFEFHTFVWFSQNPVSIKEESPNLKWSSTQIYSLGLWGIKNPDPSIG